MVKLAQFLSYTYITGQAGNIEGPYGLSPYVCLAAARGSKARDGHNVCGSSSNQATKESRDRLYLT